MSWSRFAAQEHVNYFTKSLRLAIRKQEKFAPRIYVLSAALHCCFGERGIPTTILIEVQRTRPELRRRSRRYPCEAGCAGSFAMGSADLSSSFWTSSGAAERREGKLGGSLGRSSTACSSPSNANSSSSSSILICSGCFKVLCSCAWLTPQVEVWLHAPAPWTSPFWAAHDQPTFQRSPATRKLEGQLFASIFLVPSPRSPKHPPSERNDPA